MSDYLNNLAARALNLTPLVQPRLASLFEPLTVSSGNAGHKSFENKPSVADFLSSESTRGVSDERPLTSQDDKMRSAMRSETNRPGIDRAFSSADWGGVQERQGDSLIHHPSVALSVPRINDSISSSSMIAGRDSVGLGWLRAQHRDPIDAQPNSSPFDQDEANDLENSPSRGPRVGRLEGEGSNQTGTFVTNDRSQVRPDMARISQESLAAAALIQQDRSSINSTRRAFAEVSRASDLQPTISVTIGRVDVRAVFSDPPAPRASRARQSAMSLDEYLKQRNEGHR